MTTGRFPEQFRLVYQYVMKDGRPQEQKLLDDELWDERGVVYARIVDGVPVYIGSTDGRLSKRLTAHLRGIATNTQPTPARYRTCVEGKLITIYAYQPPPMQLLDRTILVHRAVEAALIKEFKPKFTVRI